MRTTFLASNPCHARKGRWRQLAACLSLLAALSAAPAASLVQFEEGRRVVDGVALLQDAADPSAYYYLPTVPRLAQHADGTFTFLFLQHTWAHDDGGGAILHALFELSLPSEEIKALERKLRREVPGARIAGMVPLRPAETEDGQPKAGFRVTSASLTGGSPNAKPVTSGAGPLTEGSRAAFAARLDATQASLMVESLRGATSDVSVTVEAAYDAAVPAYNARVTVHQKQVYEHLSQIANRQEGFSRRQLRDVTDHLHQSGAIEVEAFDRSGPDVESRLAGILDVVTTKLTTLMFDAETGWAKRPPRHAAVDKGQIKNRVKRGFLSKLFKGTGNQRYVTDDQWVLKNIRDIEERSFEIVLDEKSVVRTPFFATGNLGGLYEALAADDRYFRVARLHEDAAYGRRTVTFQLSAGDLEDFEDEVRFVTVAFRKKRTTGDDTTAELTFTADDLASGTWSKTVSYAQAGEAPEQFFAFEYRVAWHLRSGEPIRHPARAAGWARSSDAVVDLRPPVALRRVRVECDAYAFAALGIARATIDVASTLGGEPRRQAKATLRPDGSGPESFELFHDPGTPLAYRVTWVFDDGRLEHGSLQALTDEVLRIALPAGDE